MINGIGLPQNPQGAMARRPKPEDAASHITVGVVIHCSAIYWLRIASHNMASHRIASHTITWHTIPSFCNK